MSTHDWYTILASGEAAHTQYPPLPHGPWRGADDARAALNRWRDRLGPHADEGIQAMSVRVAGPFCTRETARRSDITDGNRYLCRHDEDGRR